MNDSLKAKLVKVPPEKLVDLLLDLADESDVSWSKIERLVANPQENSSRFSKRLKEIKSRGGFVPWKYSSQFGSELTDLLKDLEGANQSVEEGYKLICDFYEADEKLFERCDDSSGTIGDVYRSEALDLYARFSKSHPDRQYIIKNTLALVAKDGYGVRDDLISEAQRFLDKDELKQLFELIAATSSSKDREYSVDWKLASIAKQLGDAPLFEKMHLKGIENPNGKLLVEVAEVYFDSGNIEKAQEILNSVADKDSFSKHEQEALQKKIFSKQGKTKELFEIIHKAFLAYPSEYTLRDLKTVTDEQEIKGHIEEVKTNILTSPWDTSMAKFLSFIERPDDLSQYVFKHQDKIDGESYYTLPELADYLIKHEQHLSAIVLLRALIEGTLRRAKSKSYYHAVGYLEKLDALAPLVSSWSPLISHEEFFVNLKKRHALKKSFWSQYKEEK